MSQEPPPSVWDLAVAATTLRASLGAGAPPGLLEAVAALQDLAVRQVPVGQRARLIAEFGQIQRALPPAIVTAQNGPYLVTNVPAVRTPLGDTLTLPPQLAPPQLALCRCGGSAFDDTEARDLADWHGRREAAIEVTQDGPYRVTGGIGLTDATGADVPRAAGSSREHYALCRCGHSQNKPFCSGMHWYVEFRDPARGVFGSEPAGSRWPSAPRTRRPCPPTPSSGRPSRPTSSGAPGPARHPRRSGTGTRPARPPPRRPAQHKPPPTTSRRRSPCPVRTRL